MPLNMLYSIYSAHQDGFVANVWGIASNVLALVCVTQLRGGLPALIIPLSGTRVIVSSANALYLFTHRYRRVRPALSAVRWTRIRWLFELGGIYQSQAFIIAQLLGPAKVTIFLIAYKIITVPVDLSFIATTPFVSAFTEAKTPA